MSDNAEYLYRLGVRVEAAERKAQSAPDNQRLAAKARALRAEFLHHYNRSGDPSPARQIA